MAFYVEAGVWSFVLIAIRRETLPQFRVQSFEVRLLPGSSGGCIGTMLASRRNTGAGDLLIRLAGGIEGILALGIALK